MPTLTVPDRTAWALAELSAREQTTPEAVLEQAVEEYRRRTFFDQLNAGYAALRADPEAWAAEQAERAVFEQANADGLPTAGGE